MADFLAAAAAAKSVAESAEQLPSAATLVVQKRKIKAEMHQWELEYEEMHSGLIPTHYDKKESPRYNHLKAQARKIEAALVLSKAGTRAQRAEEEAEEAKAARALRFAGKLAHQGNKQLGHREPDWGPDGELDGVGSMQNLFEETGSVTTFQIAAIAIFTAIPTCIFCALFSFMGFGSLNFAFLKCFVGWYKNAAGFAVLLMLFLYLFDASQWKSAGLKLLRRLLYAAVALSIGLALVMAADDYPFVPLFLFFVLMPMFWSKLLRLFKTQQHVPTATFLLALSYACIVVGVAGIGLWGLWVFGGNAWSHEEPSDNIYFWMQNMRCCQEPPALVQYLPPSSPPAPNANASLVADAATCVGDNLDRISVLLAGGAENRTHDPTCYVPPDAEDRQVCLSVLLLWMTPFVISIVGLFVAFLTYFLGKALQSDQQRRTNLGPAPRIFVFTVTIGIMGCWIAASIAGSNAQMSRVVMMGSLLIVLVLGLALEKIYGWRELMHMVMLGNNMMRKMMQFLISSDWTKAFVVWGMSPVFLLFLGLSALNQWIRVHLRRQLMVDKERKMIVTRRVHDRLMRLRTWNWTAVLRNVVTLGAAYLILQVLVMNFLTVFLCWLVEFLSTMNIIAVTGIFSGVGLIMFLLPPVPGTPVYLGAGLLLTSTAEKTWATAEYLEEKQATGAVGLYFWMAAAYAAVVALVIKICACGLQQKLLGENLRKSVAIRKFVGINSPFMKVMKLLLRERGCSMAKVAILVGGPDWPTSVTVGIFGLPLLPILAGTLPVCLLIVPTSLYGSFLIVPESAGPVYSSLGKVLLAGSAGAQMAALVAVGHFVEKATFKYAKELEVMEDDAEVVQLENAEKEMELLYHEITHWRSKEVPKRMRIVLIAAAAVMSGTCQIIFVASSSCFRDFQLALEPSFSEQVDTTLDGSVFNLVETPGLGVIALMCLSMGLNKWFANWAKKYVKAEAKKGRKPKRRASLLTRAAQKQINGQKTGILGLVMQAQDAHAAGQAAPVATAGKPSVMGGLLGQLKAAEAASKEGKAAEAASKEGEGGATDHVPDAAEEGVPSRSPPHPDSGAAADTGSEPDQPSKSTHKDGDAELAC